MSPSFSGPYDDSDQTPLGQSPLEQPPQDRPAEWREHEHDSPELNVLALELLTAAGSLELALHVVELAHRRQQDAMRNPIEFTPPPHPR